MAGLLMEKRYQEVGPLAGGFNAWRELGYPTEAVNAPDLDLSPLEPSSQPA